MMRLVVKHPYLSIVYLAALMSFRVAGAGAGDSDATAAFQTNWPRFRGWDGSGASTDAKPPQGWSAKDQNGIVWSSAIPAPGNSSPVIWGGRVFISGGTAAKREVFCYDAGTGTLHWRRAIENVPGSPLKAPEIPDEVTYAASTMATDGQRVYAMFANGDLAALNFDGEIAWSKSFGPLKNMYGFATSLAVWRENLFVQLDQGDSEAAGSKLYALDCASGKVLWQRERPVPASWATPLVIEAAGKTQIITLATPWVIAYSLAGGYELWRAELLEGEQVPSPVFAGGLVMLVSPGNSVMMALRPDGDGDVTKTRVAWTTKENVPDITSPTAADNLVFTVTDSGLVACFAVKDGGKIWDKNLEIGVKASPAILGGRLLIVGEDGALVILQAGREFHELGRSELPDKFAASPAFANGRIFLRGMTNLYGLDLTPVLGKDARK